MPCDSAMCVSESTTSDIAPPPLHLAARACSLLALANTEQARADPLLIGPELLHRPLRERGVDGRVEVHAAVVVAAVAEVIQLHLQAGAVQATVGIEPGHLHPIVQGGVLHAGLLGEQADHVRAAL